MSKNLEDDQYNAEAYLQRAHDRKAAEEEALTSRAKSRKLLTARTEHLDINKNAGKRTYVTIEMDGDREIKRGAGFFCEVCKHSSRDSQAHYAHLSSRYHLTNAGFDMRVAKGTMDQVKDRFRKHSKKRSSVAIALAAKLKRTSSSSSSSSSCSSSSTRAGGPGTSVASPKRRKTNTGDEKDGESVMESVVVETSTINNDTSHDSTEKVTDEKIEKKEEETVEETEEEKFARLMGFDSFK